MHVPAVVELENLEKSYRLGTVTVNALRGVTLKLWQAEFMVIMGAIDEAEAAQDRLRISVP